SPCASDSSACCSWAYPSRFVALVAIGVLWRRLIPNRHIEPARGGSGSGPGSIVVVRQGFNHPETVAAEANRRLLVRACAAAGCGRHLGGSRLFRSGARRLALARALALPGRLLAQGVLRARLGSLARLLRRGDDGERARRR